MSKDFNYFRIKMAYKGTNDLGAIVPIKSEDLVMATCYTEAEQIAYKLAEGKDEFGDVDIEIVLCLIKGTRLQLDCTRKC